MPTKPLEPEKQHLSQDIREAEYVFEDPVFGFKKIIAVPRLTEPQIKFLLTPSVCVIDNCSFDALDVDPIYARIPADFLSDRTVPIADKYPMEQGDPPHKQYHLDRAEYYEQLDPQSKKAVVTAMKEHGKNHLLATKKVFRPGEMDENWPPDPSKTFDRKAMIERAKRKQQGAVTPQLSEAGGQLVD